jgi:hypothetical protein
MYSGLPVEIAGNSSCWEDPNVTKLRYQILDIFLVGMLGLMGGLIINMNIGPLNVR